MNEQVEIINGELCVRSSLLYTDYTTSAGKSVAAFMSEQVYKNSVSGRRSTYRMVQGRKACRGRWTAVVWGSLDGRCKEYIVARLGCNPYQLLEGNGLAAKVVPDMAAASFLEAYRKPNGDRLSEKLKLQYTADACILNAIQEIIAKKRAMKGVYNTGSITATWSKIVHELADIKDNELLNQPGLRLHGLPLSEAKLQRKLKLYRKGGYTSLISGAIGNTNNLKRTATLENLVLCIARMPNRLFNTQILDMYRQWQAGEVEIVDTTTGEVYDRSEFVSKKGQAIKLSLGTIDSIVNNPENRIALDKHLKSWSQHQKSSPMVEFERPKKSLAIISMDDRDSVYQYKIKIGNKTRTKRVVMYMVTDVCSDAIICCVYGVTKNLVLIQECFRALYATVVANGLRWPGEVQTEQHLMSDIRPQLEAMFPYVTMLAGENSRAKDAEHTIRNLKYMTEKLMMANVGRHYGATQNFAINNDIKTISTYEEIIANLNKAIHKHNHSLHPDQKSWTNKTRWQVLLENQAVQCPYPQPEVLMPWIGNTLRKAMDVQLYYNQYVIVQHEHWLVPLEALAKLRHSKLRPYWLPEADGTIQEIFLFQDGKFICRGEKLHKPQKAKILRTPEDDALLLERLKAKAAYHKYESRIADNLGQIEILPVEELQPTPHVADLRVMPRTIHIPDLEQEEPTAVYAPSKSMRERAAEEL